MEELLSRQLPLADLVDNFTRNTLRVGRAHLNAGYLRSRRELLERYWNEFEQTHRDMSGADTLAENAYITDDRYSSTEVNFSRALGMLYEEESRLCRPAGNQLAPTAPTGQPQRQAHLPKIALPTFSGGQEEWESFRDLFRSLVHIDPGLTGVQKLHYLISCVKGSAQTALHGLEITEANYTVVWDLLKSRYDNQQLLIQHHMNALASITQLKSVSSAGLQNLHDQIARRREALRMLDLPVATWDQWFIFFATRGMDSSTRRDWEMKVNRRPNAVTYEKLIAFLQESARTQKTIELTNSQEERHSDRRRYDGHMRPRSTQAQPRSSKVLAVTNHLNKCPSCGEQHLVDQCAKFKCLNSTERKQVIRSAQLCYNCLSPGHFSRDCVPRARCVKCGQPHHTLMHDDGSRKRKTSSDRPDGGPTKRRPYASVTEATKSPEGSTNPRN